MGATAICVVEWRKRLAVETLPGVQIDPLGRVDRRNAAKILAVTPKTLSNWQTMGSGPRAFRIGGKVFYWAEEVVAFGRGERLVA
jgi:hypothetical protein